MISDALQGETISNIYFNIYDKNEQKLIEYELYLLPGRYRPPRIRLRDRILPSGAGACLDPH